MKFDILRNTIVQTIVKLGSFNRQVSTVSPPCRCACTSVDIRKHRRFWTAEFPQTQLAVWPQGLLGNEGLLDIRLENAPEALQWKPHRPRFDHLRPIYFFHRKMPPLASRWSSITRPRLWRRESEVQSRTPFDGKCEE